MSSVQLARSVHGAVLLVSGGLTLSEVRGDRGEAHAERPVTMARMIGAEILPQVREFVAAPSQP